MPGVRWVARSTPSRRSVVAGTLSTGALAIAGFPARAQSVAEFYEGKTISFIVTGGSPGGPYDLRTRLVASHIDKHIPGKPKIIVQNIYGTVPGMNQIYNTVPRDGTAISSPQRVIFTAPWQTPTGVRFDLTKFNWLGNIGPDYGVVVAWYTSPIRTADDLFTKEMVVGGSSPFTMPVVLNALIGTKFKRITGYKGIDEMFIATERGEIMGPGEASWSLVRSSKADLIREKKLRIILQNSLTKAPDLPDVPLSRDYAKGDERRILDAFLMQRTLAYPMVMPPEVPTERVAALRAAFMALSTDAEFKADAKKAGIGFDLMSGEDVQKMVDDLVAMPKPLVARIKALFHPVEK